MRRTAILLLGLVGIALTTAKALLRDRSVPDQDEIDFAAVVARRRIRMRARPFIGATILVFAASVELDLRRTLPAPTGVEVALIMFGGSLRVVIPPDWELVNALRTRAAWVSGPELRVHDDAPVMRMEGSASLSRIEIIHRPVPVAVAS